MKKEIEIYKKAKESIENRSKIELNSLLKRLNFLEGENQNLY